MANRIQLRRDTTANWENINPILADGEPGYDIVTNEVRIGDGSTAWTGLTANTISGGGGTGTSLTNNGYTFSLETDGNLTLANVGYINAAPTVAFGNASNVIITAGSTTGCSSVGGSVILNAGTSTYHSGNVLINTHLGSWRFGADGNLTFPTGNLVITPDDPAGNVAVISSADHNLITLSTGANGGTSSLWIEDYANVNTSNIAAVYANPTVGSKIVRIAVGQNGGAGPKLWDFGTDGNLTLPQGGTITEANVGLADALILTPANISSPGQQLRIYSTGVAVEGNHLHLTTGNLYATELYLGDDNYFVKLSNTGNVGIRATTQSLSSTALWTFDTTGNLTLPAGGEIHSATGTGNVVIETNDGNNTRSWTFETNGNITFPDSTVQTTAYVAANNVSRVTGSWTVTTGSHNYSFTVPQNGTYVMWVRGNIPNGIITWNATATVTNNNVPVLGQQFAWNYNGVIPMPLEITALPVQFIGTANTIITSNTYGGGPSNTFTFTVNNASGSSRTVYWGYVAQ